MEDTNFNKLENNINFVIGLVKELVEQNDSLKQQLENALKGKPDKSISEDGSDGNSKQLQINSVNDYLSKEKEEAIKEKVKNALEKLKEIHLKIS